MPRPMSVILITVIKSPLQHRKKKQGRTIERTVLGATLSGQSVINQFQNGPST